MIIDPYRFAGEAGGYSFVSAYTPAAASNAPAAFSISLGADAGSSSRHIIIVVQGSDNDVNDTTLTCAATLDGVSMTLVGTLGTAGQSDKSGDNTGIVAMFIIARSDSSTTGSLAVSVTSFAGTMDSWRVGVFRAIKLTSATPVATYTGTSSVTPTALPDTTSFSIVGFANYGVLEASAVTGTSVNDHGPTMGIGSRHGVDALSGVMSCGGADSGRGANWDYTA